MVKFRATATVVWDFESDLPPDQALDRARQQIEALSQQGMDDLRMVVRLDKLKEKVQKVRLGEFKLEEVIPYITKEDTKREYEVDGVKHQVKMNSQRYFLFRECTKCVACDLPGTRMLLEHHPADKSPHFNLYGEEDGRLVLMTKDHIHAKSCGGEDRHSNYQTMCIICNNLKGHANLTLDGIRELRRIYNENKNQVTKKKLHLLVEEAKARLSQPWEVLKAGRRKHKPKTTADAVVTTCDINVWQSGSDLVAKSAYDPAEPNQKHVACIRKGVALEPLVATKHQVMCKFSDGEVVVVSPSLVRPKE